MKDRLNEAFLLTVIAGLLTLSVAMQGFFVSKVYDHERRLSVCEIEIRFERGRLAFSGNEPGQGDL